MVQSVTTEKAAVDNIPIYRVCLSIAFHLWTLIFDYHVTFMSQNVIPV